MIREISRWYKTVCVHGEIGRDIKQLFYLSVVGELNHVVTTDRSVLFSVTRDQESAESIHVPFLQPSSIFFNMLIGYFSIHSITLQYISDRPCIKGPQ